MNNQFDILLVEDEQVVVDAASRILAAEGLTIDAISSAELALDRLSRNSYKLILSDLMLPGISGIELLKKIREFDATIPVIIITGYAMLENAVKSFKAGAFDFIPKPFDFEELAGVVYRAIRLASLKKEPEPADKASALSEPKRPKGDQLQKYYCLGQHSWVRIDEDGVSTVGVGTTFAGRMGTINSIELPLLNDEIWQGNLCVRITSQEYLTHVVWAPLSGKVIGVNTQVGKNVNLLNTDPFNRGWLIKIIPTNLKHELENLSPLTFQE